MYPALLADGGLGPIVYPLGGSVAFAGLFLSLAFITGGIWIVRRVQNHRALLSRKFCLIFLAAAMWSAAIFPLVLGLLEGEFMVPVWLAAGALLGVGYGLILLANRTPKERAKDQSPPTARMICLLVLAGIAWSVAVVVAFVGIFSPWYFLYFVAATALLLAGGKLIALAFNSPKARELSARSPGNEDLDR